MTNNNINSTLYLIGDVIVTSPTQPDIIFNDVSDPDALDDIEGIAPGIIGEIESCLLTMFLS
jgi:hypothetical protein